jgi:uncharacterized protein
MLEIDLRELARGPVETRGELAGADPLFQGLDLELAEPVRVAGRLQATGDCRRCLAPVTAPVAAEIGALFSQEPDAGDDAETYAVAADATAIDVRVAVREELILAAPRYLVCREDCRGLCPRCGKDLNAGACACPPAPVDPRWGGLVALREKLRD